MQTLKLIIGLGNLTAPAHQIPASHRSQHSARHRKQAIFIHDVPNHQPPSLSHASVEKNIVIPPMLQDASVGFVSRRQMRQHAWAHRKLYWPSIDKVFRNASDSLHMEVVLLVDATSTLASSMCWDVLINIRLQYPQVACYVVMVAPFDANAPKTLSEQVNVMGLLAEFNALGQKAWLPVNLDTDEPYDIEKLPLWQAAFLQNDVWLKQSTWAYEYLIQRVLNLPKQKIGIETFEQSIAEDFKKLHDKNRKIMLPRLLSLNSTTLRLDAASLEKLLSQVIQTRLMGVLLSADGHENSVQTHDCLRQLGWILDEDTLLLNTLADSPKSYQSIEQEWALRRDFFVKQSHQGSVAWLERIEQLKQQFQKVYDKHFREVGAELYYSVSQARLERTVNSLGAQIENSIWQSCREHLGQFNDLLLNIPAMLAYYKSLQETFELKQRREHEKYLQYKHTSDNWSHQWQNANRKERTRLEQQPLDVCAQVLEAQYVSLCQSKACLFAGKLIESLLEMYQNIMQNVLSIRQLWQDQAALLQGQLTQLQDAFDAHWVNKKFVHGTHEYALQASVSSVEFLCQLMRVDVSEWGDEMLGTWVRRMGEKQGFDALAARLAQEQWQDLVTRIASQMSQRLVGQLLKQDSETLEWVFEERLSELSKAQIQQLTSHAATAMRSSYKFDWLPMGKALWEHNVVDAAVAIVCSSSLQRPEAQAAALWMKEAVKQHQADVCVTAFDCDGQIDVVSMFSAYVPEWRPLKHYYKAYQHATQSDEALLHAHVDGSVKHLRSDAMQLKQRNLDLVRQQVLLAKIAGFVLKTEHGYQLTLRSHQDKPMLSKVFAVADLGQLVEVLPLEVVKILSEQNRLWRQQVGVMDEAKWHQRLDEILENLRQVYIPQGMDLADMDWQDAGRYVVWTRTIQYLRKYWSNESYQTPMASGALF